MPRGLIENWRGGQLGYGPAARMKIEQDRVEILSGDVTVDNSITDRSDDRKQRLGKLDGRDGCRAGARSHAKSRGD